jgi:hypothetical protein
MKHTPGPWKVVANGPHWNNEAITNYEIQYGDIGECIVDHVYEEADTHLIAAAPDMLEALELSLWLKDLWMMPEDIEECHLGEAQAMSQLYTAIVNAVAKAKGEQP